MKFAIMGLHYQLSGVTTFTAPWVRSLTEFLEKLPQGPTPLGMDLCNDTIKVYSEESTAHTHRVGGWMFKELNLDFTNEASQKHLDMASTPTKVALDIRWNSWKSQHLWIHCVNREKTKM